MSVDNKSEAGPVSPHGVAAEGPCSQAGLTVEQVARWSELIADGRDTIPADLPVADQERLRDAARQRLRRRLVELVAREIVRWARVGTCTGQEGLSHDPKCL